MKHHLSPMFQKNDVYHIYTNRSKLKCPEVTPSSCWPLTRDTRTNMSITENMVEVLVGYYFCGWLATSGFTIPLTTLCRRDTRTQFYFELQLYTSQIRAGTCFGCYYIIKVLVSISQWRYFQLLRVGHYCDNRDCSSITFALGCSKGTLPILT